jgi:hypothetical protein
MHAGNAFFAEEVGLGHKKRAYYFTYDFDKHGSVCFKKPVQVEVKQMDTDFSVKVSWSEDLLYGKPGDYLVTYGPNDFGVVAKDVFEETYFVTFIPASEISS